jgi:hypothetical protein
MADITFKIERRIGVLSRKPNGWQKEINFVSWNEREAKFDIREWNEDHSRMTKGITLTKEETIRLKEILNELSFEED